MKVNPRKAVQLVERLVDWLYLDLRDGKDVYVLDKDVSGADTIDLLNSWLSQMGAIPEEGSSPPTR